MTIDVLKNYMDTTYYIISLLCLLMANKDVKIWVNIREKNDSHLYLVHTYSNVLSKLKVEKQISNGFFFV